MYYLDCASVSQKMSTRQLLVSLARKILWEVCFSIEFCWILKVLKKKDDGWMLRKEKRSLSWFFPLRIGLAEWEEIQIFWYAKHPSVTPQLGHQIGYQWPYTILRWLVVYIWKWFFSSVIVFFALICRTTTQKRHKSRWLRPDFSTPSTPRESSTKKFSTEFRFQLTNGIRRPHETKETAYFCFWMIDTTSLAILFSLSCQGFIALFRFITAQFCPDFILLKCGDRVKLTLCWYTI